jgi:DNA repair exonuclease SbcCD ATPase subunit
MGWGISIDQDENGFVYCSEADFETASEDYKGYPPCSYTIIYEGVEAHHSEIDGARDEIGVDAAREQAWEAFGYAKRRWDRLDYAEQWRIHGEWMAEKRAEIKSCVVDKEARKKKNSELKAFDHRPVVKLEDEIKALEAELARKRAEYTELRAPLTKLEAEYAEITQPDRDKKALQELVDLEKAWASGR